MEKRIRTIEKICIIGIIVLALVIAAGASFIFLRPTESVMADVGTNEDEGSETKLAERADYLPDSLYYGKKLPVTQFQTKDGSLRDLREYEGKKLILMFWGSWCNYCDKVLSHSAEYENVLAGTDYEFILINKLDPEKEESVEKAENYLKENNISFESLYDAGLTAYKAYGLKLIPSLLVLDESGRLRYMSVTSMESGAELRDIMDYVESGGASSTLKFIKENMTGQSGGIYTSYIDKNGEHPVGRDVLSESQGLMMEYAALSGDRELFNRSWQYAKDNLLYEGVFSWYITKDGARAQANALLDDLRIYKALKAANGLWGGYEADLKTVADGIRSHNAADGRPVSFYDFKQKRGGNTLPLFYIDIEALNDLGIGAEAEKILREGYISDEFPLYYPYYDYTTKKYGKESMNTAEALMTVYHAVKAGVANQRSIDWLEEMAASGTLAARYDVDGKVVSGFNYDSTAVYAIAALIGSEAGNARLYTSARNRMEKYYVTEQTSRKGSFSDKEDGSDITAFDQLMSLMVYGRTKGIVFDD